MAKARIKVPEVVKRGAVFEVRLLIRHPMETGFRYNNVGQKIPKNIVHTVRCVYNGAEVFHAELFPALPPIRISRFLPRPKGRASWSVCGQTIPESRHQSA